MKTLFDRLYESNRDRKGMPFIDRGLTTLLHTRVLSVSQDYLSYVENAYPGLIVFNHISRISDPDNVYDVVLNESEVEQFLYFLHDRNKQIEARRKEYVEGLKNLIEGK